MYSKHLITRRSFLSLLLGAPALLGAASESAASEKPRKRPVGPKIRHYYITAEDVMWDYAPTGRDLVDGSAIPALYAGHTRWEKTRFIEYTDATFQTVKTQPMWLGILGPVIRGEVGDTIQVHFLNRSKKAHNLHPHGLRYDKDSEGAHYLPQRRGAVVPPEQSWVYTWHADEDSGPGPDDGDSVVWWYHPHVEEGLETNRGLLGPIIISRAGRAHPDATPKDVDQEFVASFMIFDEMDKKEAGLMHGINGLIFGNLQGLVMQEGQRVRWHLMAMGNERDLHTPHWHGKTVRQRRHRTDVVELLPASMVSVDMVADNPGTWLFHCQVSDHMEAGMMTTYTIRPHPRPCPLEFLEGDFWQKRNGKFLLRVKNSGTKSIQSFRLASEAFTIPGYVYPLPFHAASNSELQPGAEISFEREDWIFKSETIQGWIFYPASITFADNTKWEPREQGECFTTFWRDKDHPPMPMKPITQYGMGEMDPD